MSAIEPTRSGASRAVLAARATVGEATTEATARAAARAATRDGLGSVSSRFAKLAGVAARGAARTTGNPPARSGFVPPRRMTASAPGIARATGSKGESVLGNLLHRYRESMRPASGAPENQKYFLKRLEERNKINQAIQDYMRDLVEQAQKLNQKVRTASDSKELPRVTSTDLEAFTAGAAALPADYGQDGTSWTRDGTPVDVGDAMGLNRGTGAAPDEESSWKETQVEVRDDTLERKIAPGDLERAEDDDD